MKHVQKTVLMFFILFQLSYTFAQQLVLRGDYPDPSVVKIGDTYWASATTSNWAPVYPMLRSRDLVNWQTAGYVFPEMPGWADYYFWAPELSYDNGKIYIYYSAHKKNGNLCVGIASADKPEGPYKDHGPLICQEVGSIDAFPMRDEHGKLHLVWKEDANSVSKPTPIWISELNEERTALVGEKKELFRNDKNWEANLVEGVSMIRNGEYYYAFYAAAGCCGAACTYGVGIARSKSLHGPWEKDEKNPVLTHTDKWKCPGHGTPIKKDGKNYFLYHAYDARSSVYTGRQGLLMEYRFTDDGWIEFLQNDNAVDEEQLDNALSDFSETTLGPQWQWSVFQKPGYEVKTGKLILNASDSAAGGLLGHKILSANYTATVDVEAVSSKSRGGIAVIGDENNLVAALYDGKKISVFTRRNGADSLISTAAVGSATTLRLRVKSDKGKSLVFSFSAGGSNFRLLNKQPLDASNLPPWDRALRVGLLSKGRTGHTVFDNFRLVYE